jgi:hypothetical protein
VNEDCALYDGRRPGADAVAAALDGCTVKSTTVEESTAPSAGGKVLTYEVRDMTEFDAAKSKAESTCRSQYGGVAHYLDRTPGPNGDTVRFECAS